MTQSFNKGCHLHLIDGSHFVFRAYHALPPLTRKSDGLIIGAVSGFCNMLHRYISENHGPHAPTHVAVIFDKGSHTFRNEIFPEYKANRDDTPEDLRPQLPLTRAATEAFGIACKEADGFEADDIIATLATRARQVGGRVTIMSSDKDLMQLVGDGVEMFDAMKNRPIDREDVLKKFGVYPERVVDVQALAGDSVDNIPGAPGIGIKTAAALINEFGDLDSLLDRVEDISQPKRRDTLKQYREQIQISKRLVQLECNMQLDFTFDELEVRKPDTDRLFAFLNEMEFQTLTKRIAKSLGREAPESVTTRAESRRAWIHDPSGPSIEESNYECVRDIETLQTWIDKIQNRGWVAFDTETTGLDEMSAEFVGVSLCVDIGHACYIPLQHRESVDADFFGEARQSTGQVLADQLPLKETLSALKIILEDGGILKIGQNIKYDMHILANYGIQLAPVDDTMLMSYVLHSGKHRHGLDTLSERYLSHKPISLKSLLGVGKSARTFDYVPINEATAYAAEDADLTLRLWTKFKPNLHHDRVTTVYETLERPMVSVVAQMERIGVKIDREALAKMSQSFDRNIIALETTIHKLAGEDFNIASPKQLGRILFEKLALATGKRGKTGAYVTDAHALEDLASEHEIVAKVLEWRQLSKLKSTYSDALQEHINARTNRVHTSFLIAGASTGRMASSDPNLQNIPIRTDEGRRIREAFIAERGHLLLSLDYSQIELRILAHIADIAALRQAFGDGIDIHALTASEVFDVPLDELTSDVRRRAKAINFGIIYGVSAFGLARNLGISNSEARDFIDRYFRRFPGIRDYMEETKTFAKKHGYVKTLFGRKIYTPEISARGPRAGFAQRAAINAPIQGTAADIIRRAMIKLSPAIENRPAKMLLQVHDELLFEVDESAVEEIASLASNVMENAATPAVHLNVDLVVEAGTGHNWAEAH